MQSIGGEHSETTYRKQNLATMIRASLETTPREQADRRSGLKKLLAELEQI
ncbi:MAG: hypothetical protein ABIA76_06345 [Candidatus Diapherotrites archaeon]